MQYNTTSYEVLSDRDINGDLKAWFLQVQNLNWIDFSLDEGGMIHVTGVEAVFERNITVAEQVQ